MIIISICDSYVYASPTAAFVGTCPMMHLIVVFTPEMIPSKVASVIGIVEICVFHCGLVAAEKLVPLIKQQRTAYGRIVHAMNAVKDYNPQQQYKIHQAHYPLIQNCFFIDGLGGAGKTFLYNTLLSSIRSGNGIALAVASSGIAALLLDGGATAHSRLKIQVNGINGHSICYIPKQSNEANFIRATSLFLRDEAPMQHKHTFEAVDWTFQDLTELDKPFGGVVMVMRGDFR